MSATYDLPRDLLWDFQYGRTLIEEAQAALEKAIADRANLRDQVRDLLRSHPAGVKLHSVIYRLDDYGEIVEFPAPVDSYSLKFPAPAEPEPSPISDTARDLAEALTSPPVGGGYPQLAAHPVVARSNDLVDVLDPRD